MISRGNANAVIYAERSKVFDRLYKHYGIEFSANATEESFGELLGDATMFDGNNSKNLGVIVTRVVFLELQRRLREEKLDDQFADFLKFGNGVSIGMSL